MKKLGEILTESGMISPEQIQSLLEDQKTSGKKLGELIVEKGILSEQQIMNAREYQIKIPFVDIGALQIDPEAPGLISEAMAKRHCAIPVGFEDGELVLVMNDPLDLVAIDDVRYATGKDVRPKMSGRTDILAAIDRSYGRENAQKAVAELQKEFNLDEIARIGQEITSSEVSNAPVVKLVNSIIEHAIKVGASDIHIEPMEDRMRVRIRVDGELQDIMKSPRAAHAAVVTRVKIMGGMDIAEKRIPQDGRVETTINGKPVDMRLSILPLVTGEKIVIRILGRTDMTFSRQALGFSQENMTLFDKIVKSPHGVLLVSGPTGSGKTTTLYTVLKELNRISTNIVTVEDPVEYRMAGINQVQVNLKAGMTFASGLRSILRQDPDIILIGEIRDNETAQIAIRSAITGHLVLSTIHTNDAASTITRLVDMGIEPYLVSTSVVGVIAQRLVKKVCTRCKISYKPDHTEMMLLKLKEPRPLFKGSGCPACNFSGYRGRTAIHEVMLVGRDVRELIDRRASVDQIRSLASRMGTVSLMESCAKLVLDGVTTVEEMMKVTYTIE